MDRVDIVVCCAFNVLFAGGGVPRSVHLGLGAPCLGQEGHEAERAGGGQQGDPREGSAVL